MRARGIAVVIGGVVVAVLGVLLALTFFNSRDDSTLGSAAGPGSERKAGAEPAVKAGNVVLQFSDERETAALRALAKDTGGVPTPAVVAAGEAVILRRETGIRVPVVALTAHRRLEANGAGDARLRAFIEYWLGRDDG